MAIIPAGLSDGSVSCRCKIKDIEVKGSMASKNNVIKFPGRSSIDAVFEATLLLKAAYTVLTRQIPEQKARDIIYLLAKNSEPLEEGETVSCEITG